MSSIDILTKNHNINIKALIPGFSDEINKSDKVRIEAEQLINDKKINKYILIPFVEDVYKYYFVMIL